jgi:hypothetical protein
MGQKYGEANRNKNKKESVCSKTIISSEMKGQDSLLNKNTANYNRTGQYKQLDNKPEKTMQHKSCFAVKQKIAFSTP